MVKRADIIRKLHDEKGMTYEEIGRLYGMSKQAAHQAAHPSEGDHFHESAILKIRYVGLREWMLENRVSITMLEQRCGRTKLHHSLSGNCEPRKGTIDRILSVTGLTYEKCFKEE